ncbi:MAG: hypothetical protein D6714_10010, partial [Bacteroidetes bacterium]
MLWLVGHCGLSAQTEGFPAENDRTYIYRISHDEARKLYAGQQPEDTWFHTLVDTFSNNYYPESLPPGHYMFARAQWEQIEVRFQSVHTLSVEVLNNKRDLRLQVADSSGVAVTDARILFDQKKPIPFDPKTQTYRLKKWNKSGTLTIETPDEIAFFDLRRKYDKPLIVRRYQYFSRSKAGRWITLPFRALAFPVRYVYRGVKYRQWHLRKRARKRKQKRALKGYIVTNQPKYLPGDTVKMKAFVTDYKGRIRRDPVNLVFYGRRGKSFFERTLTPDKAGNVIFEFRLGDSLRLDQNYFLRVQPPGKNQSGYGMGLSFRYEDYELDKTRYTFEREKAVFYAGEQVVLLAEGKDKNNFTLPDAEMRLILKTESATKFHEKEVLVPDTLWTTRLALNPDGETRIVVPDSIFPAADLEVLAMAYFTNSAGEKHTKSLRFTYLQKQIEIKIALDGPDIVATAFLNGDTLETDAVLHRTNAQNLRSTMPVRLPFREKVRPFVQTYQFIAGEARQSFYILGEEARFPTGVRAFGRRTADSIFIQIQNPRGIPIHYSIQTPHRIVEEGTTEAPLFMFQKKTLGTVPYFLKYDYVWGGKSRLEEKTFQPYKKLLSVEVRQPQNISPGETVAVQIEVTDYKGRKVPGVNLTAGAITSEFGREGNYKAPQVSYKRARLPFEINHFNLRAKPVPRTTRLPLQPQWYDRMGLDSLFFYRMRHPENGVLFRYDTIVRDTFYKDLAQFAPWLVKGGLAQPIYLIYCNNKLVYWSDVDDDPPYSFVGRAGWNTLLIRTQEWEIKVDSVWLKNGHKLEMVIDLDHYGKSPRSKNIRQARTQPELTAFEKNLLKNHIFFLRTVYQNARNHLWQSPENIHIFYQKNLRNLAIGPFEGFNNLTFMVQGSFQNTFLFEPGFQYDILKNRERLYEDTRFSPKKSYKLRPPSLKRPGQLVYVPSDIRPTLPEKRFIPFSRWRHQSKPGNGRYRFLPPKDSAFMAVVLVENDSVWHIFQPQNQTIKNLLPK